MKVIILLTLTLFTCLCSFSQNQNSYETFKTDSLVKIGDKLLYKGKNISATNPYKKAIHTVPNTYLEKKIGIYYKLGKAYQSARDMDSAYYFYKFGDSLIPNTASDTILAYKNFNWASYHYSNQDIDSAMKAVLEGLSFAENSKNAKVLAYGYSHIGTLFNYQKSLLKAREYFDLQMKYARETNNNNEIAYAHYNYGILAIENKNFEEAERQLVISDSLFKSVGNTKGRFIAKGSLSKSIFFNGDPARTIAMGNELIDLMEEFEFRGNTQKMFKNTLTLGKIYNQDTISKEDILKAKKIAEQNIEITPDAPIKVAQNEAIVNYIEKTKDQDNPEENSVFAELELNARMQEALRMQDSIYQNNLDSKYLELEAKYNNEKNQREILQLNQERTKNQLDLSKQRNRNQWLGMMIALGSIGFLGFFIYARNRKQRLEQQRQIEVILARELEKETIGEKLHTDIANQLQEIALSLPLPHAASQQKEILEVKSEIKKISREVVSISFGESEFDSQLITLASKFHSDSLKLYLKGHKEIEWEPISETVKRNLYLVIRESLYNTQQHALASHVTIYFKKSEKALDLTIQDDGKGFDLDYYKPGLGVRNMRKRIHEIQGKIHIQSQPNKGTQIVIQVGL